MTNSISTRLSHVIEELKFVLEDTGTRPQAPFVIRLPKADFVSLWTTLERELATTAPRNIHKEQLPSFQFDGITIERIKADQE